MLYNPLALKVTFYKRLTALRGQAFEEEAELTDDYKNNNYY